MDFVCAVCFGTQCEKLEETGEVCCSACFTVSQDYREEIAEEGDYLLNSQTFRTIRQSQTSGTSIDELTLEGYVQRLLEYYMKGMQQILVVQCNVMIKEMGVRNELLDVVKKNWIQFLPTLKVFDSQWYEKLLNLKGEDLIPDKIRMTPKKKGAQSVAESTTNMEEDTDDIEMKKDTSKSQWMTRKHVQYILAKELRRTFPLVHTLSLLYLGLHQLRECFTAFDIERLARVERLPLFSAWTLLPESPPILGIHHRSLFRVSAFPRFQSIEFGAWTISYRLKLRLPPINYYALTLRFILELGLDPKKHLHHVYRLYDLLTPYQFWLNGQQFTPSPSETVVSLIVITLKCLYPFGYANMKNKISNSSVSLETQSSNGLGIHEENQKGKEKERKKRKKQKGQQLELQVNEGNFRGEANTLSNESENLQNSLWYGSSEWDVKDLLLSLQKGRKEKELTLNRLEVLDMYLRFCSDDLFGVETSKSKFEVLWQLFKRTEKENDFKEKREVSKFKKQKVSKNAKNNDGDDINDNNDVAETDGKSSDTDFDSSDDSENDDDDDDVIRYGKDLPFDIQNVDSLELRAFIQSCGFSLASLVNEEYNNDMYLSFPGKEFITSDYFFVLYYCSQLVDSSPTRIHNCVVKMEKCMFEIESRLK